VNIRSGSLAARAAAVALLLFLAAAPTLTTTTATTAAHSVVGSQDVHNLTGGELWGG
jgi:hypothetical protein